MGLGDFLGGVASGVTDILSTPGVVPSLIGAFGPNQGGPGLSQFNRIGAEGGGILSPGVGGVGDQIRNLLVGQTPGVCPTQVQPGFAASPGRCRPIRELRAVNPSTGRIESWRHQGTPILYSGDRATAKRYAKAAGFTLRRRSGGGTRTRRRATRRRS